MIGRGRLGAHLLVPGRTAKPGQWPDRCSWNSNTVTTPKLPLPRTVRTDPDAANDRPGWYFGLQHWADGLGTAYLALLAPAAMGCLAVAVLRTRVLPRWTGYVFVAAMVLLIGPVRRVPRRSTATTPALTPTRSQAAARRPAPGNLHPVASPQRLPAREAAPELAVLCRSAPANSTKAHAQSRQGGCG
jgi:hypothetical protein